MAVEIANAHLQGTLALPSRTVSPGRCKFICNWMNGCVGAEYFAEPVNPYELEIPDYFLKVRHPMDMQTLTE